MFPDIQESDGDSDWEATNRDADLHSVDGEDDTASSTVSDTDDFSSVDEEAEAEAKALAAEKAKKKSKKLQAAKSKPKVKAKAKSAAKPKPKPAPEEPPAIARAPEPETAKRVQPQLVPKAHKSAPKLVQPALMAAMSKKPQDAKPTVKIVKYNASSASGIAGRPMKNAKVVIPAAHCPSEYPSVKAFRENPPTDPKQYVRVNVEGRRKPASYRAFCVKGLQPPHNVTYYVLASAENDAVALAHLGIPKTALYSPVGKQLATAARMQHKGNSEGASKTMRSALAEQDALRNAIGWQDSCDDLSLQPAIMGLELAEHILAPKSPPAISLKRPREPEAAHDDAPLEENSKIVKKFAQELQKVVGARITTITVAIDVASC